MAVPRMTERFARERLRHELKRRRIRVLRTESVAPGLARITFGGEDLEGFAAPGPGDHVKVFFPDPASGELTLPDFSSGRPRVPEGGGEVIVRDYTPYAFRPDAASGPELDIDFVLHGDNGPASAWAARASAGDELAIGGPRGSLLPPTGIDGAVIVADESALPAAARWLDALHDLPVTGLFSVEDPGTAVYLSGREHDRHRLRWFSGADREAALAEALRGLAISEGALVFLAGEANALIPLRRYLRRELGLPKEQVEAHGYWKRGIIALDHHAPLDPSDP